MRFFILLPAAAMAVCPTAGVVADSNVSHKAANAARAEISIGWACKNSGYKGQIYDLSLKRAELLLEGSGYSAVSAKMLVDTYRKQTEADRGTQSTIARGSCDRVWQSLNKPLNDKGWTSNLPACKTQSVQRPSWCHTTN